jgi:hypothetical protein
MTIGILLPVRSKILSEAEDAVDVWLDWSEAASPAVMRAPRIQQPAYVFRGSTASHLDGQGCDVVDPDTMGPDVHVIFGCGCVERVPASSLHLR